jgi:hypothetical protein
MTAELKPSDCLRQSAYNAALVLIRHEALTAEQIAELHRAICDRLEGAIFRGAADGR